MGISPDGLSHRAALPAVNNSAWRAFPRKPGARPLLVAGEMQRDMVPLRVSIHHDSQSSGNGSTATLGSGDEVQGKGQRRLWARGTEQCQAGSVGSPAPKPAGRACNRKASRVHRLEGLALNQVCLDCCSIPVQMLCGGRRRAQGASL